MGVMIFAIFTHFHTISGWDRLSCGFVSKSVKLVGIGNVVENENLSMQHDQLLVKVLAVSTQSA